MRDAQRRQRKRAQEINKERDVSIEQNDQIDMGLLIFKINNNKNRSQYAESGLNLAKSQWTVGGKNNLQQL